MFQWLRSVNEEVDKTFVTTRSFRVHDAAMRVRSTHEPVRKLRSTSFMHQNNTSVVREIRTSALVLSAAAEAA